MYVHVVFWHQDGILCMEIFATHAAAIRFTDNLRSQGRDPWYVEKAVRGGD